MIPREVLWDRCQKAGLTEDDIKRLAKPYGLVMDEMDTQAARQDPVADPRRQQELRIQALGAAISRRDWHATERAYEAIRDKFYVPSFSEGDR